MTRFLAFLILSAAMVLAQAKNPMAGTWQCASASPEGDQFRWVLTVTEQDGKLAGTLAGDPGEFPISDAKVEGDAFTFKVTVNTEVYTIEGKVAGDSFAGAYTGPQSRGTIKGTRQAS
jgi:hypothetical protein